MSRLFYKFGAMNSGKSTALLQAAYNYEERGQTVLIAKPSIDTKDDHVLSRLGAKRKVDIHVTPELNLYETFQTLYEQQHNTGGTIDCLLVDEAQFLEPEQVNQLFYIAVEMGVPVLAYGIRSDFKSNAFPGSRRLLEISHALEELKTICRCGKKAIFNGRKIDGVFIKEGAQVAIDGQQAEYESLCGKCYLQKVGHFS